MGMEQAEVDQAHCIRASNADERGAVSREVLVLHMQATGLVVGHSLVI